MKVVKLAGVSDNLKLALDALQKKQIKVGWGESAVYPSGTPVAYVAVVQEFGSSKNKIPARAPFRLSISENETKWRQTAAKVLKFVALGTQTVENGMEAIGMNVAGDVRKTISKINSPALKTSTVKARLRGKKQGKSVSLTAAKPLVDSSYMLNSLTSEVATK